MYNSAKEHLEEMSELTRNLSYNDINIVKKNGKKKEDNNLEMENEKDKEQREKWFWDGEKIIKERDGRYVLGYY